jgi:hypothetical protein
MSQVALAAPKEPSCMASEFPYSEKMSDQQLNRLFGSLEREALVQYFYAELTTPQENPVVGRKLASYLEKTEKQSDLKDYYKALAEAAHFNQTSTSSNPIPMIEICSLQNRVYTILSEKESRLN